MEIYKITNLVNGKIYIGKDINCDKSYFGSGVFIKKVIDKYGKSNFTKEIIDSCNDYNELSIKEKYWIEFYKSNGSTLYNITEGGDGGDTWSNNPNLKSLKEKFYRKIIIDGIEYESINSASKSLDLNRSVIRYRLKSFKFKNYFYKDNEINIKNKKFIDKLETKRKKISIDDIVYNSISEACDVIGKRHDYVLWRLQSSSYKNWFYISDSDTNKSIETGEIRKKSVSILGCQYESIADAARISGIDRQLIRYRLKSNNYPDYFYI